MRKPLSPHSCGRVTESFLPTLQDTEHPTLLRNRPTPPHPKSSTEVVERGMTDGRGLVVRVELAEMDADMGQGVKGAETRLEGIAYLSICWAFCLRGQYNM